MLPNSSPASVAQGDLFEAAAASSTDHHADARRYDPLTSWAAAFANQPGRLRLRARVLDLLARAGAEGMTDAELADAMPGQHPGSVSKRRCDLMRDGLVIRTDRTRPTRYGSQAIVWAVSPAVKLWSGLPAEFCGCAMPAVLDRVCEVCQLPVLAAVVHYQGAA